MRTNTYDAARNRVTIDADRAAAFQQLAAYYANVFAAGRAEYAIPQGALTDTAKQKQTGSILLVDLLGGQHRAPRIDDDLHEQLAA